MIPTLQLGQFGRAGGLRDPYFNSVALLLNPNGNDGDTTIVDSSLKNRSSTATGNAQVSSAQAFPGNSVSLKFDGTGDYITATDTPDIVLSGDFTIEGFVRIAARAADQALIGLGGVNWYLYRRSSGGTPANRLNLWDGTATRIVGSVALASDTWTHFAWTRNGNTHQLWVGGATNGTYNPGSAPSIDPTSISLGRYPAGGDEMNGYLSGVRITVGVDRTNGAAFTPPSSGRWPQR